jgi:hypothetical protein
LAETCSQKFKHKASLGNVGCRPAGLSIITEIATLFISPVPAWQATRTHLSWSLVLKNLADTGLLTILEARDTRVLEVNTYETSPERGNLWIT